MDVIKHIFLQKGTASHKGRFTVKDFSAFLDMKILRVGLIKSAP